MKKCFCNSQKDLVRLFHEFEPKIHAIFDYLNGKINSRNICIYNVGYYSTDNYAQFQYPNRMTIFIGSIVDHYYDVNQAPKIRYDSVMSVAALCIAHELYHADQIIDAKLYGNDSKYQNMIEDAAEYNAELFCINNAIEFKRIFGFDYMLSRPSVSDFSATDSEKINDENLLTYLYCAMLGTFRSPQIAQEIKELAEKSNLMIGVYIQDHLVDAFYVKINGKVVLDIDHMNQVLSNVVAPDQSTRQFTMRVNEEYIKADDIFIYYINVKGYKYDAFI